MSVEAPAPPAAASPPRKGLAIASMVLGLLSVPTLGLLLVGAILSVVLGVVALVKASRHPAQYGGQALAVTGIVAAVVSVLVMPMLLGIIAAFFIPTYLRRQVAAHEKAAISSVRAVVAAQHAYQAKNHGFYDTLDCLAVPEPCLAGYQGPPFLPHDVASLAPANGYRFRFDPLVEDRADSAATVSMSYFAYVAVPINPGHTGVRAFCGDASGRICYTADGEMPELEQARCPPAEECVDLR